MYTIARSLVPITFGCILTLTGYMEMASHDAIFNPEKRINRILAYLFAIATILSMIALLLSLLFFPVTKD